MQLGISDYKPYFALPEEEILASKIMEAIDAFFRDFSKYGIIGVRIEDLGSPSDLYRTEFALEVIAADQCGGKPSEWLIAAERGYQQFCFYQRESTMALLHCTLKKVINCRLKVYINAASSPTPIPDPEAHVEMVDHLVDRYVSILNAHIKDAYAGSAGYYVRRIG